MRRAKWGFGAAVVVGLAWFLSNFFNLNIGGIGTDEGAQVGLPTETAVTEPAEDAPDDRPPLQSEPLDEQSVSTLGPTDSIGSSGAIEVLIEDHTFAVRRGTGDEAVWVPAEPDVIASYARQVEGDETGVRVRIYRRPSARASAEKSLTETLTSAGISASQIDMQAPFPANE